MKAVIAVAVAGILLAAVAILVFPVEALPQPQSQTYDCYRAPVLHCDLVANQFTSKSLYGVFQKIYGVTSPFEAVKGINSGGNALSIKGHVGEYVTIPNSLSLSPKTFTVSFWVKRSFGYGLDGTIASHVNGEKTSGWYIKSIVLTGHAAKIQFSVVNTDGEIFTVGLPLNNGSEFQKVVAQFDGSNVKLAINNSSTTNSTAFRGTYQPDPDTPFNLGRLGQDVWKGTIDELHFGQSYWPFDNNTKDISGTNDGRLASLVVSMAFTPDGRLFFSEKNTGLIRVMKDDKVLAQPFVKVQSEFAEHQGLLGITVDPKFSVNHFIYAYYTQVDNKTKTPFNRVVRFTESNNTAVAGAEKILLDNITASLNGEFAGGALAFGKDDNLYITVGYANIFKLAQNMSSLAGKVLRITRDGEIPQDNPFPNSPIFTIGHRSQFGITFNSNGVGFITDNGDKHYDEINQLVSGGNYGFPTTQQLNSAPELDTVNIKPIRSYWNDLSPTQAIFYHLSKNENLNTNLNDKLLFGSYNKGKLIALGLEPTTNKLQDETEIIFPEMTDNIIAIAESPITGDVYFGGYNIYKLTSVVVPSTARLQHQQMDFVTLTGSKIKNLEMTNSSLSITLSNDTNTNKVDVKIPNKVLHGIFKVQGDDVKGFKIGQSGSGRITNQSSTTVHIDLNPPSGKGLITINGTS